MTLAQLIVTIERIAASQPTVHTIVREDVFLLNDHPAAKYPAVTWAQGVHRAEAGGAWHTWQIYLYYIDRVTKGRGGSNEIAVQSDGIECLRNIIRELRAADVLRVGSYTLHPFRERFSDECAGVYADIVLQTPAAGDCYDAFTAYFAGLEPRTFQLIDSAGERSENTSKII